MNILFKVRKMRAIILASMKILNGKKKKIIANYDELTDNYFYFE